MIDMHLHTDTAYSPGYTNILQECFPLSLPTSLSLSFSPADRVSTQPFKKDKNKSLAFYLICSRIKI